MSAPDHAGYHRHKGFTLIELIAGIVIFAVAVSAMTNVLFPHATKSVDPVYQVRAAELGHSLLNEILGKAFDENTDYTTGTRCNESVSGCSTTMGPDTGETTSSDYDDVDDYNGYSNTDARIDSSTTYATLYKNFTFTVSVIYDGDYNDQTVDGGLAAKRIDIDIVTPGGENFRFSGYKGNF